MKKITKITSVILSILMFVYALPLEGFANSFSDDMPGSFYDQDVVSDDTAIYDEEDSRGQFVMYEMDAYREEDVKHYRMTDGSFTAVKFDEAVHYEKDDEWKEINNLLVKNEDGTAYHNIDSNTAYTFSSNEEAASVSCGFSDYSISLTLQNDETKPEPAITDEEPSF